MRKIRSGLLKFGAAFRKIERPDVFFFSGLGFLSYGAWLAYEPAGFIITGVVLLTLSVIGGSKETVGSKTP